MGRYVALAAILMSSFTTVLNTSMLRVASPLLLDEFKISYSNLTWVYNSYQIVYAILLPVFGFIGDRFGRKRWLVLGLGVFALGSVLCGLSWSFWSLILFRVIQAIGAAAIFPNGVVAATSLFAQEHRGKVMGIWGTAISLGDVSGPTIGGLIIGLVGWKYTFFVNAPVALFAIISISLTMKSDAVKPERFSFDYAGALSLGVIVISLVSALQVGSESGWMAPAVMAMLALFAVAVPVFRRSEATAKQPVIDFALFRNPVFVACLLTSGAHLVAIQGTQFLMPLFLSQVHGFDSLAIGLAMIPLAGIRLIVSPLSGVIADRYGNTLPVGLGLAFRTAALVLCAFLTPGAPLFAITMFLVLDGAGAALVWSPVMNAMLGAVPNEKASSAMGVFNMVRLIMGVVGTTIVGISMDRLFNGTYSANSPVPGFFQSYIGLSIITALGFLAVRRLVPKTP